MDDPVLAPDVIKDVDNSKLDQYLEFSRSACVPGGGFNSEQALEMLYKSDGDILRATRRLIHNDLNFPVWSRDEITQFERLIAVHGKNFYLISKDLKTKSVKECVEFYYLWKKSVHRSGARNHRSINIHNNINITNNTISANNSLTSNMNNNNNNNNINSNNNNLHNNDTIIKLEMPQIATAEIFPCKICGRIFEKIKSRSAHMKRHKNEISN